MIQEITASIVIEMMGRPVEHVQSVMQQLLEKLDSENGVSIEAKNVHDPKVVEQKDKDGNIIKVEKGKELVSTFAEVELKCSNVLDLVRVVFSYMPSHVEIISPRTINMENFDLGAVLTEIIRKLHQYDAIAKNAMIQNQMLVSKLQQFQQTQSQISEPIITRNLDKPKKNKKKSSKTKTTKKSGNKK